MIHIIIILESPKYIWATATLFIKALISQFYFFKRTNGHVDQYNSTIFK